MAVNVGSAVAYLELDTSKFTSGLTKARSDLKVFLDSSATAGQKITGLANAMGNVGSVLNKSVTVPLAGVGVAAVKTSMDFEKAMSAVKAVSGATQTEFEQLRQKAIDLGASTTFSATEVADAMTEMAKAGWSSQQIMAGMQGVLDATAASGEELSTVATIVADAITTFGLSAEDSTRVADLLAQSANAGTIGVYDLGESFKYIGPVAKTMNFSIEDVTTAITALSMSGIKGSQAGTTLRTMFARLVKPTDNVKIAMKELGIVLTDGEGNFKDMNTILAEMRSTFQTLTPEQQTYYATVLAGQEGMSGLTSLLGMTQEEYDKVADSMKNATGVAKETAEVMQDNLAGAVEQLGGAVESAGIAIGNKLTPYIRKATEFVNDAVDAFNDLSDEEQDNIIKMGLFAASVGPVLTVGSKLLKTLTNVGKGFVTFNSEISLFVQAVGLSKRGMEDAAMQTGTLYKGLQALKSGFSGLLNPIGLTITAVTALVGLWAAEQVLYDKRIEKLAEETESEKWLTEAINEQAEARKKSQESVQESIDSAQEEAAYTQSLVDKLKEVVDETGRVKDGKQGYAQFIVGELSNALGQEISLVDGQIQGYSDLMASIDETIEKKKALAIQESIHEDYTQAVKEQAEAQRNYSERLMEVSENEQKVADAEKERDEALKALRDSQTGVYGSTKLTKEEQEKLSEAYARATREYEVASKELDNSKDSLDKATESMEYYNQIVQNYEGLSAALVSGSAEEISLALAKVQESFLTAETATRESLEGQAETIREKYEEMQNALAEGVPGVTQEMVDSLGQLVDAADAELQAKIDSDKAILVQKFSEIGIQAPQAMIDSLAEKSPETLQTVTTMLDSLKNGTALKSEEIKTLFSQLGIDAPTNLINQLVSLEPSVQANAINLLAQLQSAEQAKRPEILAQLNDLGVNVDNSLADGMESNKGKVTSKGTEVGKAGHDSIQDEMDKDVESPDVDENTVSSAKGVADDARSSMQSVFDRNPIVATIKGVVKSVGSAIGGLFDGSHAGGLDYVPFDGYVAQLHKGERVLTKEENEAYSSSGKSSVGGDTFIFYDTKPTPYEYARQMKKVKRELLSGF